MSIIPDDGPADGAGSLPVFRAGFYDCLIARSDALFELGDALRCQNGSVASLPVLSLAGVNSTMLSTPGTLTLIICGAGWRATDQEGARTDRARGRRHRMAGPDANCSPGRLYCHVTGHGRGQDQMVPDWAYSFIAAVEPGRISWTQILDAQRLGPDDDAAEVTAIQVRCTVERLVASGQHCQGDAPIVVDAGYDVPRLAYQLRDLPVVVIGRLHSDRVLYRAAPPYAGIGRPQRHGAPFHLADPSTWETPVAATVTDTDRYGKFAARAWEGLHPWLKQRSAWIDHDETLPVIEDTVIRIQSERLPHTGTPEPAWLWASAGGIDDELLDSLWSAWLRRFDIEHTFQFLKQTPGWTVPQVRGPEAANR